MRNIWVIGRHEYLTGLLRPSFIIITLLIPFLGLVGLGIAAFAGGQASSFLANQFDPGIHNIGVVDSSGLFTPILPQFDQDIKPGSDAPHFHPYANEDEARAAMKDSKIDVLLIFPSNYLDTGDISVVSAKDNIAVSFVENSGDVENFIRSHLLRNTEDQPLLRRLVNPVVHSEKHDLEGKEIGGQSGSNFFVDYLLPYFIAIFLAVSIFSSGGFLLQGVSQEKTTRVVEIILSSVTSWELLVGKVIGLGLLGVTRVGFWLFSGFALAQVSSGALGMPMTLANKPELFILGGVYYILGFLVFAILMATCGALGATQQEAQQLSGMFSMVAVLPMWIGGFIFSNPNATIARILSWFPLTAPTMMLLRLSLGTVSPVDIVGSIVVLVITVPVVIWLGSKLFRYGLLMYGKRPSFRQMLHILRQP